MLDEEKHTKKIFDRPNDMKNSFFLFSPPKNLMIKKNSHKHKLTKKKKLYDKLCLIRFRIVVSSSISVLMWMRLDFGKKNFLCQKIEVFGDEKKNHRNL